MFDIVVNIIAVSFVFSLGTLFGAWWAIGRASGDQFELDMQASKHNSPDASLETGAFNKALK